MARIALHKKNAEIAAPAMRLSELALLAAIVFVLVKAIITFAAPQSVWKTVDTAAGGAAVPVSELSAPAFNRSFDPFYRDTVLANAPVFTAIGQDAPETSLDLKLFGLRADTGETGSAILETPDRVQKTYRIGDEIISGVILRAVNKDYIVLEADGQLERLTFMKPESALTAPPPETEPFARPARFSAAQFLAQVQISAVTGGNGILGMRVSPRGTGKMFAASGLKPGDIITAVNGISVTDRAAMMQLSTTLNQDGGASLSLLRNNAPMTLQVGR